MKKILSCLLAVLCLISLMAPAMAAEEVVSPAADGDVATQGSDSETTNQLLTYREYSTAHSAVYPEQSYTVTGNAAVGSGLVPIEALDGVKNAARFESGTATFTVTVQQAGYYRLEMLYQTLPGKGKELGLALTLNGKTPFDKAQVMEFSGLWKNDLPEDGKFATDSRGNAVLPDQVQVHQWIRREAADSEGEYADPFYFWLEKGDNTLTLTNLEEPFVLGAITFKPADEAPVYAKPTLPTNTPTNYIQLLEGEYADLKSSKTIIPTYNKGDPAVSPSDPTTLLRNTIGGGASWQTPGEYVTWKFTVPADGYYKIGIKYSQSQQRGLESSRRIRLDGKPVYAELEQVRFGYTSTFDNLVLSAGDEEVLIWLTAGVTHELTMETTVGNIAENLRVLNQILDTLNTLYRKIIMVTGANPDPTRDYDLEAEIPGITATFGTVADSLEEQYRKFTQMSDKGGSEAETLMELVDKLRDFVEKPYTVAERLTSYRDSLSSLATWLIARQQQPLEVDYIAIFTPDQTMPKAQSSFWARVVYELKNFISSFTMDYNNMSTGSKETPVEVWVANGREQSLIVKELTDSRFVEESGIPVSVKLVKLGLVQCVMAGVGPDVALSVERTLPVNLALRNAVIDLSQFDTYDEVVKRFSDTAMTPYLFNGGAYALPETQSFHMMFYRTDIFEELNITPPDNWDEFYQVINIVQRNNMEIGLPFAADISSMFPTLLLQKGGSYYNEEQTASTLCTPVGFEAFTQWTEFYTQYSFSMVKDDYNRFRTGEMPLTIMPYTFYSQLAVAAPEINGLWKMVQIPGTLKEDGTVDRTEAATGTANVIFRDADSPENSWKFLDWWSSAKVQAAYGQKIETVLGAAGRYATANLEAVTMLPWTNDELKAIDVQRQYVAEIPEIAGSYYMSRNINNAFLAVNRGENLRESLKYWDNETNLEIKRKRRELGLE